MATMRELKKMLCDTGWSVVDLNWKMLKFGQMAKLVRWEIKKDDLKNGISQIPVNSKSRYRR